MTQLPKFTLHTQRQRQAPRRRISYDSPAATVAYGLITWGILLFSLYMAVRAFPGFLDVLKHGRPS